ncbi:RF-1 domain family protein [Acanthocheilonema viteae]
MHRLRQYFNKLSLLQTKQPEHHHFSRRRAMMAMNLLDVFRLANKIEKRFMRSSGPGGQNVNMVNTKCQIRFNLNEADWLSPEIQEVFRKRFARLLNKQHDVVISSDISRIQTENQKDCFKKLQAMLLECNNELLNNRSPTDQDKVIMGDRARRAAQRRLYAKRIHSQKKKSRDPYESI